MHKWTILCAAVVLGVVVATVADARVYSYGGTESFTIPPTSGGRESDTRAKTGRVSWREMIRP